MVVQLTPEKLADKIRTASAEFVLLDVREPEEREAARIEPSIHIPMDDVPSRVAELPRDKPIVVYCHTGTRSMMVAGYLEGQGFHLISNLSGGIDAWSLRVDPKVPRYF